MNPQTVNHGSTAAKPSPDPTRTGYTFAQWELPVGTAYNFGTPVTGPITLTAKWNINTYTVTFNSSGGSAVNPATVDYNTTVTKPANPTRTGYDFVQWELPVGTAYNFSTPVTGNITLTAKWNIKTYTVTFNSNGGSAVSPATVDSNTTVTKPANPTRVGHTFVRWELPIETEYNFSTPVTSNITLTAKWNINTYTVTFNSGGGTAVANQTVNHGSMVAKPTDPTRMGYDFVQWELPVGTAYNFSTPVTGNIALTAKWNIKTYTVTFNSGGSSVSPATVDSNTTVTKPANPTRAGYNFVQWELPVGTAYNFSTPVTGNITLTAKWDIINYTIAYHPNGGTIIPPMTVGYNIESGTIPLPSMQDRCGFVFEGWADNEALSSPAMSFTPNANNLGNKNFYAKWTGGLMTPNANLLSYTIPNPTYTSQAIAPITVSPKPENQCPLDDNITVLYNGQNTPPKDAGTYAISASIAENGSYRAATVPLGNLTINKADITVSVSATAKNKVYDATTTAEVNFSFSPLLGNDRISANDYSAVANFNSSNAGTSIPVTGTITWLTNKNYNISPQPLSFTSSADITRATGVLQIAQPDYELSNPKSYYIINKSPFIQSSDIHIEYKGDEGSFTYRPNRVGNWTIKAWFETTGNYTGAEDSVTFTVTRGNATTVIHNIAFEESGFANDITLNGKLRKYFVAGTELCNVKSTKVRITVIEQDIILHWGKDGNDPGRIKDGFDFYEKDVDFGKPGLDTLFYTLFSKDGIYREDDTLLIETPIPFEAIAGQKWNNVIFINNNSFTNGGYEFSDYKWFRNGNPVGEAQFYSAGPGSADTLDPKDIYKVLMHTTDGMRISTCEGSPKPKVPLAAAKPALTKQVLGINGKTAKTGSRIYNLKGSKTENTPAGVYIIEDK